MYYIDQFIFLVYTDMLRVDCEASSIKHSRNPMPDSAHLILLTM